MALGESEVLGQVRQALRLAREAGATRAVLHRMFESALAAGKRVRTETEIARHPLSVASIGFELAAKVFGDLSERTLLVLGAGETGTLFAEQAVDGGRRATCASPTGPRERAEALRGADRRQRRRVGGLPRGAAGGRRRRRRDGEPDAGRVDARTSRRRCASAAAGRCSSSTSPCRATSSPTSRRSTTSTPTASTTSRAWPRRTAGAAPARFRRPRRSSRRSSPGSSRWFGNLAVVPTLNGSAARGSAALRDAELARLPAEERERFRAFADAIAARLLHEPMRRLKSETDASRKLDRVEAVRHLFDLDE